MAPKRLVVKFDGKATGIDYSGHYTQTYNLGCEVEAAAFDLCKMRIPEQVNMPQKMDITHGNTQKMSFYHQGPSPGNTLMPHSGQDMSIPQQHVPHTFFTDEGPSPGNTVMPQQNPEHSFFHEIPSEGNTLMPQSETRHRVPRNPFRIGE